MKAYLKIRDVNDASCQQDFLAAEKALTQLCNIPRATHTTQSESMAMLKALIGKRVTFAVWKQPSTISAGSAWYCMSDARTTAPPMPRLSMSLPATPSAPNKRPRNDDYAAYDSD